MDPIYRVRKKKKKKGYYFFKVYTDDPWECVTKKRKYKCLWKKFPVRVTLMASKSSAWPQRQWIGRIPRDPEFVPAARPVKPFRPSFGGKKMSN